jgi:hypothetical protein
LSNYPLRMALIITLLLFINVPLTFSRHRQSRNENLIRQGLHSIIVHYPRAIYEGDTDWKHASHKSTTLSRKPTEKYEQIARSQDQEDIMLYENWFYGVSNGIVIEVQLERNYIYCHIKLPSQEHWMDIHYQIRTCLSVLRIGHL